MPAPTPRGVARPTGVLAWCAELARFGAVGALAYVVDTGAFNLLVYGPGRLMAPHPVSAKITSAVLATLVAWVGNRYWTFRHARRSEPGRELAMFLLVNVGGIVIAAGTLWFSRYVLGYTSQLADNISANIIGVGLGTLFRYLCYRFVVFTGGDDDARPRPTPPAASPHRG
ncbi:MAG: GtrA family protein [Bowdeniella nasicola]|nr:GtrA family protein [Bowdeniella nasicola]